MTSLRSPLLQLLERVAQGITIWEPFRRSGPEMAEFQDTAARLLELERQGLIGRCITQTNQTAGQDYYDLVMVQGGITDEGQRLLNEHGRANHNLSHS